jgi:hypothetical protein
LTVTIKVSGVPGQLFAVGVTITIAVTGVVPALVAVKLPVLALPVVPKPTSTLLVQL